MSTEASAALPSAAAHRSPAFTWFLALAPLVLLGGLLALLVGVGPADLLSNGAPPVERLTVTRVELEPGLIRLSVLNDGPDEVNIAQVSVDDAFWNFSASPGTRLDHLDRTVITIPYPWVQGESHAVRLLTSTGVTFDHQIGVAIETPRPSARFFWVFTLVGLYVGVVPVAIGLFWYPLIGRIDRRGLEFLIALTLGLLAFLLVDSTHDGLEAAAAVPGSFQGPALFVFAAAAAYLALDAVGAWLKARRQRSVAEQAGVAGIATSGWILALLIAIGIGLHNFGEGLAIGSAFALGEMALGTMLIIGFTLHNTTEGLAIVAPLARDAGQHGRPAPLMKLAQLGLIGGVPTILGAWIGGFVYSPAIAVMFLAFGVGGIAQVSRQILMQSAGTRGAAAYFRAPHVVAGLAAGVVVMYVTGLVVG